MSNRPILTRPIVDHSLKRSGRRQGTGRGNKLQKTGTADNIVRQRMLLGDITMTVHNMTQLLIGVRVGLLEAQGKLAAVQEKLRVLEALCRVGQVDG